MNRIYSYEPPARRQMDSHKPNTTMQPVHGQKEGLTKALLCLMHAMLNFAGFQVCLNETTSKACSILPHNHPIPKMPFPSLYQQHAGMPSSCSPPLPAYIVLILPSFKFVPAPCRHALNNHAMPPPCFTATDREGEKGKRGEGEGGRVG